MSRSVISRITSRNGIPHTSELVGLEVRFGTAFTELADATEEILVATKAAEAAANREEEGAVGANYRDAGGLLVFAHWLRGYGDCLLDLSERVTRLTLDELTMQRLPIRKERNNA